MALGPVAEFDVASATADAAPSVVSTVSDSVGDASFNAPAFQDLVYGQLTKTAGGDFELLMEMAGPVPVAPPLPPPARVEIWWNFVFDLDPTAYPQGYPVAPGNPLYPDFIVYVSWDGAEFAGSAIDRRPLLTGGNAIITPVEFSFSIDRKIVEAVLPFELIGVVPTSFPWRLATVDWAGPLGSNGFNVPDSTDFSILNP